MLLVATVGSHRLLAADGPSPAAAAAVVSAGVPPTAPLGGAAVPESSAPDPVLVSELEERGFVGYAPSPESRDITCAAEGCGLERIASVFESAWRGVEPGTALPSDTPWTAAVFAPLPGPLARPWNVCAEGVSPDPEALERRSVLHVGF